MGRPAPAVAPMGGGPLGAQPIEQGRGVRVEVDADGGEWGSVVDPDALLHPWLHVDAEAAHAGPSGRSVTVHLALLPRPSPTAVLSVCSFPGVGVRAGR